MVAGKDFEPGEWETGSVGLDQDEGFADALPRESLEELGSQVRIGCILGVTYFCRGEPTPDNDRVGLRFGCLVPHASDLSFSREHSEHRWLTADETSEFLLDGHWLSELIQCSELDRLYMTKELRELHWSGDFETR